MTTKAKYNIWKKSCHVMTLTDTHWNTEKTWCIYAFCRFRECEVRDPTFKLMIEGPNVMV